MRQGPNKTCSCESWRRTSHKARHQQDTLPEWSKGVDSSSTSASCVGSNPTGVNLENFGISGWRSGWMEWKEGVG